MIKYNEKENAINKTLFSRLEHVGGFTKFMEEKMFVCVICGRVTSLSLSTSNMGDKLVCVGCDIEIFNRDVDKLLEFQEKGKYAR